MILEHELLECLLDEDWSLPRVLSFLEDHHADAWLIVLRHAEEGNVVLVDKGDAVLPGWRVREVVRNKEVSDEILVRCTDKGGELVV